MKEKGFVEGASRITCLHAKDARRHKHWCKYYENDNHCSYSSSKCIGSSHCKYYTEIEAEIITDVMHKRYEPTIWSGYPKDLNEHFVTVSRAFDRKKKCPCCGGNVEQQQVFVLIFDILVKCIRKRRSDSFIWCTAVLKE